MWTGCGHCWPTCRCPGSPTGARSWPSTCHGGCGRTLRARRTGCSATSTGGEDRLTVHPRPALLVRRRAGDGRHVLDADPGCGPADDATAVTAAQLRDVVERLVAAGPWAQGEPDIVIVTDAGYDVTRLAWVLRDLPVELAGRLRGDRVMRLPKPPRVYDPQ